MNISSGELYHIYNQGNNKETLFYTDADYLQFLHLFRKCVFPHCQVLAWCLMPNHFHFLIYATEESAIPKRVGNISSCALSNGFRVLQSKYAQYLNQKNKRSGSLFRPKTKAKPLSENDRHYGFTAFQYIHQNPLKAGLVKRMEDWVYSSFADFAGLRNGQLCDQLLAAQLLDFDKDDFVTLSYQAIDKEKLAHIFCD